LDGLEDHRVVKENEKHGNNEMFRSTRHW